MKKIKQQSLFNIANTYYVNNEYVKAFLLYDFLFSHNDVYDDVLLACFSFNRDISLSHIDNSIVGDLKKYSSDHRKNEVCKILDRDGYGDIIKNFIQRKNSYENHEKTNISISKKNDAVKKNKRIKNTLWRAQEMIRNDDYDGALQFAYKNADDYEKKAIVALQANALSVYASDDDKWLDYINTYLKQFEIAPVEFLWAGKSRFDRLTVTIKKSLTESLLVTVIMPAYNAEKTIEKSVESILTQTWNNIELIIIDDASTDATWSILQRICSGDSRVKIYRNRANVGPYASKNIGLRAAKGDYITGHDADDWAHPERIEKHMQYMLSQGNKIKASLCGCIRITKDGHFSRISKCGINSRDGILSAALITCLFEAKYLKEVLGGWDAVRFAGDSEIIKRVEKITASPLPRYHFPGIIALDTPDSLTNHPDHGYNPLTGLSGARKEYVDRYSAWHEEVSAENAFMPFPQNKRKFAIPDAVAVNRSDLDKTLLGHTNEDIDDIITHPIRGEDHCDVCIVTNLRYPGGNASSTIDEIRYFTEKNKRVLVVHCPNINTHAKPVSDRYEDYSDICEYFYNITAIKTDLLIVRHPSVLVSSKFTDLSEKIQSENTAIIINNSMYRPNGDIMYSLNELLNNIKKINCRKKLIFPLGPAIRKELRLSEIQGVAELASFDWTPTFNVNQYVFRPKKYFSFPAIIGRHGRDAAEKWIENRSQLLSVYPDSKELEIRILGGADYAVSIIGYQPDNWKIYSFGSKPPAEYLSEIDCFVNFPHSNLNEAFGRTVMEAVFCGVPCVLPFRFRETFEYMAFFCSPENVADLVQRLSMYPTTRIAYLTHIRHYAVEKYDTMVLEKRYEMLTGNGDMQMHNMNMIMPEKLMHYKKWIETGEMLNGVCF